MIRDLGKELEKHNRTIGGGEGVPTDSPDPDTDFFQDVLYEFANRGSSRDEETEEARIIRAFIADELRPVVHIIYDEIENNWHFNRGLFRLILGYEVEKITIKDINIIYNDDDQRDRMLRTAREEGFCAELVSIATCTGEELITQMLMRYKSGRFFIYVKLFEVLNPFSLRV